MSDREYNGRLYLRRQAKGRGVWWMSFSLNGVRIRQTTGERDLAKAEQVMRSRFAAARDILPKQVANVPRAPKPEHPIEVPRDILRELAFAILKLTDPEPEHDLSVAELGALLGRSEGTVREWVARGHFPGAYHLPSSGKRAAAWRIPRAALEAFRNRKQTPIQDWRALRGKR